MFFRELSFSRIDAPYLPLSHIQTNFPCFFEIHFGKGIAEHEQLFDVLRKHGKVETATHAIEVGGTGSWKTFMVSDRKTGEILIEKKFYKADFNDLLTDEKFKPYLDQLIEGVFVRGIENPAEMEIDTESYEEVRSIALEIEDDLIS